MKWCIFLNNKEYELSGYVLDYFSNIKNSDIEIEYFSEKNNVSKTDYYSDIYNIKYKDSFNIKDYDYVFMLSNDLSMLKINLNNYLDKIIFLNNIYYNLKLNNDLIIPCYTGINKFNKKKILLENKLSIMLFETIDTEELKKIFIHYDNIDFYTYDENNLESNFDNLKKSSYVYIKTFNQKYIYLALSYGCFIVSNNNFNNYYNLNCSINLLKSVIKYDLDIVYDDLNYYISERNIKLDKIIKSKINNFIYNNNNTCWFSNIVDTIYLPKPNIFIETGTYLGDGINRVIDDFRTVHSIELNETFYNNVSERFNDNNNVILHLGDSSEVMNKKIFSINEPVLFYLDAHFSGGETAFGKEEDKGCPILRELEILNKRTHKDIIIVDDMRLMGKQSYSGIKDSNIYPVTLFDFRHVNLESIKKTITKKVIYLESDTIDRLIIICL